MSKHGVLQRQDEKGFHVALLQECDVITTL